MYANAPIAAFQNVIYFFVTLLMLFAPDLAYANLVINDDPANPQHKQDFESLLAECEELSPAVHELMEIIRRSPRNITVNPGRSQPGIDWDGFDSNDVDLDDMDAAPIPSRNPATGKWEMPAGFSPLAASRCQILAHFMWERFMAQYLRHLRPNDFTPAHESGNDYERRVRRDFGQEGDPIDTNGNGAGDATTVYINDDFYVEDTSFGPGGVPRPSRVKKVKLVCMFTCDPNTGRFPVGGDTEAEARAAAQQICAPAPLGSTSICRSK